LDVLILHSGYDLSLKELAELAGISTKTLWKEMPKLERLNLVKHTRRIGHAKMVTLNRESNPVVEHLVRLEFDISLNEMKPSK
jgi:predicted transcriptional regulator